MVEPVSTGITLAKIGQAVGIASSIGGMFGGGGGTSLKDVSRQHKIGYQWDRYRALDLPQHQVRGWQKAGIHPLAGIGLNPASGTSVSVSGGNERSNIQRASDAGQNLSRAIGATTQGAKQKQMEDLQLERASLENDLLRTQITNVGSQAGDPPNVQTLPDEQISSRPNSPEITASEKPKPLMSEFSLGKTHDGKELTMLAPPSGQFDEWGEVGGTALFLELAYKRGYLHYKNGKYYASKKLANTKSVKALKKGLTSYLNDPRHKYKNNKSWYLQGR